MNRKIINMLKLSLLFLMTCVVVIISGKLSKIKALIKAILFQVKKIMNSFCNENPMFFTKLFKPKSIIADYSEEQLFRLKQTTAGLYKIQKMKSGSNFFYSIVIPVYKPQKEFFKTLLISCLNQSIEDFEILLGFDGTQPSHVYDVINELKISHSNEMKKLTYFEFERSETSKGISSTTNKLALKAKGDFLVFIDHDDWVRPDLIYRYDLMLRNTSEAKNKVIYCDEFKIDELGNRLPGTYLKKSDVVPFPYVFVNWICHCLMVPKDVFSSIGGLRTECDGAQDYDLILRLDLAGLKFMRCPIGLYAWRVHALSTAKNTGVKSYVNDAGVKAFADYVEKKDLNWKISLGDVETTYFADPVLKTSQNIQAIIPFRDEFDLTIKAVGSLLKQNNPNLKITLVNNNSSQQNINEVIKNHFNNSSNIEILDINEPFNFSRVCNQAVVKTSFKNINLLLFMNNDVELFDNAVLEMEKWIDQEKIGAVGCKLLYANEQLQHGGIDCRDDRDYYEVCWAHTNYQFLKGMKGFHDIQRVVDAATAACLLIKKTVFQDIGCFDEDFYPIAFSDTDLCAKLFKKGYYVFYNPKAVGFHYESVTRAKNAIEDFESSRAVFELKGNIQPNLSFYYR